MNELDRDQLAELRNSKIGFVFQQFNLLGRTSAVENVALPLLYADVSARERHRRAVEALQELGLAGWEEHRPNQLSGGQQQRVAIARSLVNHPRIILADEPTGALDTRTSVDIMGVFQRLNREAGITIVVVTHEPDIAAFANRNITLRDGQVVEDVKILQPRQASGINRQELTAV